MRETLKRVVIDRLPGSREEFRSMMEGQIATPEGAAAMFVAAMLMTAADRATGFECMCDICIDPPDERVFSAIVPEGAELEKIARSYLTENPESGALTVTVKLTDEKSLRRHMKTVYVGCSGTASYRPLTLASRPPRYMKKRFGFKNNYYEDPWLAAEYPSMVLPLTGS